MSGRSSASSAASSAPPFSAGVGARAILTVDLDVVAANYALINSKLSSGRAGAVVKADAYGLGLAAVAPALQAAGCRDYFVADVAEGIELRSIISDGRIFILNGPAPGAMHEFARNRLVPVLNDLGQIELWAGFARGNTALGAAIHVDTGISRLGLPPEEVEILARAPRRLEGLAIACIMSHLACADQPDHPLNAHQLATFKTARAKLPPAPASLANSAGVFLGPEYHFDLVRPGGALYGLKPLQTGSNPLAQALTLEAPILQVRDVDSPMTVGYGASFHVAARGRIATIPVGYADGFPRSLSNRGSAFLGGIRIPVVGRVSMDLVTLDVSGVPADLARPGAIVELIGPHHSVDDLADEAGTIGHAVLTGLGRRIVRRYRHGPHNAAGM